VNTTVSYACNGQTLAAIQDHPFARTNLRAAEMVSRHGYEKTKTKISVTRYRHLLH